MSSCGPSLSLIKCAWWCSCFDDGGRFSFGHIKEKIWAAFLLDSNNPLWAARGKSSQPRDPQSLGDTKCRTFPTTTNSLAQIGRKWSSRAWAGPPSSLEPHRATAAVNDHHNNFLPSVCPKVTRT